MSVVNLQRKIRSSRNSKHHHQIRTFDNGVLLTLKSFLNFGFVMQKWSPFILKTSLQFVRHFLCINEDFFLSFVMKCASFEMCLIMIIIFRRHDNRILNIFCLSNISKRKEQIRFSFFFLLDFFRKYNFESASFSLIGYAGCLPISQMYFLLILLFVNIKVKARSGCVSDRFNQIYCRTAFTKVIRGITFSQHRKPYVFEKWMSLSL